jgi:hypothetical protein
MNTNTKKQELNLEIKKTIRLSFDAMIHDVLKGRRSIKDFHNQLTFEVTQKKMEITGQLF